MVKVPNSQETKFRFSEHPWLSYILLSVVLVIMIVLVNVAAQLIGIPPDAPYMPFISPTIPHLFTLFFLAPFVLKIPYGKRTFKHYLKDIRLSNNKPLLPLIALGITTSLILLFSFSITSVLFHLSQGNSIGIGFLQRLVNLKTSLPPISLSFIVAFPAIFEEISGRGIFLAQFRQHYSRNQTILITGLLFGLMHLLNLLGETEPSFVIRQVIFGWGVGLFYAYMVFKVNSLLPAMLFHYLVNWFIGSFSGYLQLNLTEAEYILITALNMLFVVPLLFLWVKFFSRKFLPEMISDID